MKVEQPMQFQKMPISVPSPSKNFVMSIYFPSVIPLFNIMSLSLNELNF